MTRDGRAIPVLVNVGQRDDARLAMAEGADGVGMLRTEFAFLGRQQPPGEDEQYLAYRAIADAVGIVRSIVRTLDLGADVPAWNAQPETNPALGNRGLRLTLADGELFDTQLRAIARLARDRPIGVMFPMVTTVDELRRAHARLRSFTDRSVDIGITVEVPAAALTAEVFAPSVDFFAVGDQRPHPVHARRRPDQRRRRRPRRRPPPGGPPPAAPGDRRRRAPRPAGERRR